MRNQHNHGHIILIVVALAISLSLINEGWSHGDETSIIPETLSVKAGGELKVEVKGLVGTKTATFSLTGLAGKFDLGQFPISNDDFTQLLAIPADLPPGSYRLTVEGEGKSAKVIITIN